MSLTDRHRLHTHPTFSNVGLSERSGAVSIVSRQGYETRVKGRAGRIHLTKLQIEKGNLCELGLFQGGIPESRFSENPELGNPKMRQHLGFPFQKER